MKNLCEAFSKLFMLEEIIKHTLLVELTKLLLEAEKSIYKG